MQHAQPDDVCMLDPKLKPRSGLDLAQISGRSNEDPNIQYRFTAGQELVLAASDS